MECGKVDFFNIEHLNLKLKNVTCSIPYQNESRGKEEG